ncbi:MAG: 2,3,4,5-tetrahydropyridine-2,6-dicarboxylate N-succinyltransferase [Planctomycetes bacterium]|nr:2,3,4,5-tetrahydropyridine-2,6-dicarboxylate N-succinyltransferase [Planctomycetota bacterium]
MSSAATPPPTSPSTPPAGSSGDAPRFAAARERIERAFAANDLASERPALVAAVEQAIAALDAGELRVAEKLATVAVGTPSTWTTHAWVKQAILLYFRLRGLETVTVGPFEFHDKVPLKRNLAAAGVRIVPHGICRYGAFLEKGVVMMPSYVNIGAYVGSGTMVDTWATVGSCAQVGRDVHLSGGVGLGGVLEPPQAQPVVIEDGCFIGSRAIVVEGVIVEREAVLGAGVVLTASTPIVDVNAVPARITKGRVPARAVVIPGTLPKKFPGGEFGTPCALLIGERKASTDLKTSLNAALREFDVAV